MTLLAALAAFGHFLAFFALASALALQLGLLSASIGADTARRLRRADRAAGLAALALLGFGCWRVLSFDKGSAYYFSNWLFWTKLALFAGVFVLALRGVRLYASWGATLAAGAAPALDEATVAGLRRAIHWQLMLIMGMLLCASLMARGYGI